MTTEQTDGFPVDQATEPPVIVQLTILRFRGIEKLSWLPAKGVNIILGGGDVGKTTVVEAVALLLSPTNYSTLSDTDYYSRDVAQGFEIEAVMSLPPESGIGFQFKPSWPWEWNGREAVVPDPEAKPGDPVYRLRVRGTEDLDLVYEIVQPDGTSESLSVVLRRSIGLVRLGGDERYERDLRLVQGSALDRLLSDKSLRSRLAVELADSDVKSQLSTEKTKALSDLDQAFIDQQLPRGLDLAVIGGPGTSIASMVGLTADQNGTQLPLARWGAGTRRLSALAIARRNHGQAPVTVVDEVERGLEPYRQKELVNKLQDSLSQTFATTHSPFVIAAGSTTTFWYVDSAGRIGRLDGAKIERVRKSDPGTFLSRLAVVAEGATEVGFVDALLRRALGAQLEAHGIHLCDGGGHEPTLGVLEALSQGGLRFAGFADNENLYAKRWKRVADVIGTRLFRWTEGCIEENVINRVPEVKLEALIVDEEGVKTGYRLRTLAKRLGVDGKVDFASLSEEAGGSLRSVIAEAALGKVPDGKADEKKIYKSHARDWFKTVAGGQELEEKMFSLGLWPDLNDQLLPFVNAILQDIGLDEVQDLQP